MTKLFRALLEAFKISDNPPRKMPKKPPVDEIQAAAECREVLEKVAANVKTAAGYKGPIWDEVHEMTLDELIEIIKRGY